MCRRSRPRGPGRVPCLKRRQVPREARLAAAPQPGVRQIVEKCADGLCGSVAIGWSVDIVRQVRPTCHAHVVQDSRNRANLLRFEAQNALLPSACVRSLQFRCHIGRRFMLFDDLGPRIRTYGGSESRFQSLNRDVGPDAMKIRDRLEWAGGKRCTIC